MFLYLSPKLSFMWTPNGETVTALKPSAFKPSSALVISALVQFCAMAHEDMVLSRYTLPFWSRKRRFSALTLAGQAKVGVVPAASCMEELPEAVPSFPRPVPFCGGEPDVGVAANVSSKIAATISRDLNTYKRLKDRVVTATLRLRCEGSLIRNASRRSARSANGTERERRANL